ncbi:MerR family transcriptional regulator [Vibrio sp. qd031]|uniref:DUF3612 domain-containing protein n=1 Tax=Vibrio sp. qd031 TaxID=1603038 RepID=UPI000A10DD79|nr:DUF3612 domain-containing protein [Vibrio sp. qd031]ORT49729.1 MerR family transcriptional regulator [Vibrio sp. qd031]
MKSKNSLARQTHFLGTKVRNLRKRNNLTMEDLSTRCVRINPDYAPSVSYLSMIERGKRIPSADMLEVIADVFQKPFEWFLDDEPEESHITPHKSGKGGLAGIALEPSFLFTPDILQNAIPELLSQAGIGGRQFAQLLIRAHQENNQNHFPDLEKRAEEIGGKRLPLSVEDLMDIAKQLGVRIHWISETPRAIRNELGIDGKEIITSHFEPPGHIYLNDMLKQFPTRLKYDLAVYIGHCVLHNEQGVKTSLRVGHHSNWNDAQNQNLDLNAADILDAWRDFESSFFAGALLCPKVPFRQLLDRNGYEIASHQLAQVSPSVAMRRMTVVSPYPNWHYFDAYGPGKLKAVYRGNGIPLPWGNMRQVEDPCRHWAVFRMLSTPSNGTSAQISVLDVAGQPRIYCCESVYMRDPAGNNRVLCAGLDLNPAIAAQGIDSIEMAQQLKEACVSHHGEVAIAPSIKTALSKVSKILNVGWIERGIEKPARIICSRGTVCPREPKCY